MNPPSHHATAAFAVENRCKRYEGSFALVTGAARGLGRVIASRLAEEGASVVIADIDEPTLKITRDDLQCETGREIVAFSGDLSVAGVAQRMVDEMVGRFGAIDLLVNNAAALIRMPLVDMTEELMQKAVDGNVWTTLRCCKAVLPAMIARKYGRIVNIGGEAWRTGAPFHTLLAGVGKGSMVGLTATLAGEVATTGITVNCVSPGGIETEADGRRPGGPTVARDPSWTPDSVLEAMRKRGSASPMGRMAHPTEVAAAVAFLGSREASFVTGQHLGVSGGYAML